MNRSIVISESSYMDTISITLVTSILYIYSAQTHTFNQLLNQSIYRSDSYQPPEPRREHDSLLRRIRLSLIEDLCQIVLFVLLLDYKQHGPLDALPHYNFLFMYLVRFRCMYGCMYV